MKAMIFAAGMGTRLKPLTDSMPKALVKVAGKPLLWHIIMKLKGAGYDDFVINIHHFASMIVDYVHSENDFGVKVAFSDESDFLRETGGGILHARKLLEGSGRFMVHNVDIMSNLDIDWFTRASGKLIDDGALAVLLVSKRKSSRYLLFDEKCRLVGWINENSLEIKSPFSDIKSGKGLERCTRLAFSGIHCLSENIFGALSEYSKALGEEKFSIIDFYLSLACGMKVYGICPAAEDFSLVDVGKTESLQSLETALRCQRLDSVQLSDNKEDKQNR